MRFVPVRVLGGVVVLLYSFAITSADALTKLIAQSYPPAQLFAVAGILVASLSVLSAYVRRNTHGAVTAQMRTKFPAVMAMRCALGMAASIAFYHGFLLLPLAEMFLFIGMMPLLVALLSGPMLSEPVRPLAWGALLIGSLGVICLFVQGNTDLGAGHLAAFIACVLGSVSLVLARGMTREEGGCLAQVFWPNLAVGVGMALVLPFGFEPMPLSDVICVCAYAAAVFLARLLCMVALKLLPVFVATPLMNIQFLWALLVGAVVFGDPIRAPVVLGGLLIVASGLVLMWERTPEVMPAQVTSRPPRG